MANSSATTACQTLRNLKKTNKPKLEPNLTHRVSVYMLASSATYRFSQHFRVSAREAYEWCTDYRPDDLTLMGENGTRGIQRLTQDTLILTEIVKIAGRKMRKLKLIKLNPSELEWYNVQLVGPNKHSEFLYKIHPEGRNASRLDFTGLLVVYSNRKVPRNRLRRIANIERGYDSKAWVRLAKAMENDLLPKKNS